MKKIYIITLILFFASFSSTTESNINDLFSRCEASARENKFDVHKQIHSELDHAISTLAEYQREAHSYEADLIYIDALLYKGALREAHAHILELAEAFFPILSRESEILTTCLMDPETHIDEFKMRFAPIALRLALKLGQYYTHVNELETAQAVTERLITLLEETRDPDDPFQIVSHKFNAKSYAQLGEIYLLQNRYDEADTLFTFALSLFDENERNIEKGFILLKSAEHAIMTSNYEHADTLLAQATQNLASSPYGLALTRLRHSEKEIASNQITTTTRDNLNTALHYFEDIGDQHHRGLALIALSRVAENDEECEQLICNAADLAQKKYLPLLACLVRR